MAPAALTASVASSVVVAPVAPAVLVVAANQKAAAVKSFQGIVAAAAVEGTLDPGIQLARTEAVQTAVVAAEQTVDVEAWKSAVGKPG